MTGVTGITGVLGGKALWYLTRGTGLVALVLLTASVLLGILELSQWATPRWPRFVTAGLHKNISLLVTAFLGAHIVTSVLDSFAPIGWLDAVLPFTSDYRPIWLGLGALAGDLLIALIITSLVRQRLGYRSWRAVHWFAYASWPVALVHGLGTGSDVRTPWVLGLTGVCAALVLGAVWWRIAAGWPAQRGIRTAAVVTSVVVPLAVTIWLLLGPMRPGWAGRAGTPTKLLSNQSLPALPLAASGPEVTT